VHEGITLVLGGSGVKGAANIGTLEPLRKHKSKIRRIVASGIGALAAAQFALGRDLKLLIDHLIPFFSEHQRQLWALEQLGGLPRSESRRALNSYSYFLRTRLFCRANITRISILSWESVESELEEVFGNTDFSELEIPLVISAIDLRRGIEVLLDNGRLVDCLKAGIAFPGLFPPVLIGNQELVSSTLYCELPLDSLNEADHPIVAIDIPTRIMGRYPKSVIDAVAQVDEIRSAAIKKRLLTKADVVLCLESLKTFRLVSYEQIAEMASLAYQEMDRLLQLRSDLIDRPTY
jgi:NTE family protein